MSNDFYQLNQSPAYAGGSRPAPVNTTGFVGMILSLIGLLTCGILSPIGLLISLFGLSREPRGSAVLGVVLGLIGSAWIAFVGYATVTGIIVAKETIETVIETTETTASLSMGADRIDQYRTENGRIPDAVTGNEIVDDIDDSWGNSILYAVEEKERYVLRSAGPDGQFHTGDDITSSMADFQNQRQRRGREERSVVLDEMVERAIPTEIGDGGGLTVQDGDRQVIIRPGGIKVEGDGRVEIRGGVLSVEDGERSVRIEIPNLRSDGGQGNEPLMKRGQLDEQDQ